jgi:hypothetical protein
MGSKRWVIPTGFCNIKLINLLVLVQGTFRSGGRSCHKHPGMESRRAGPCELEQPVLFSRTPWGKKPSKADASNFY